MSEDGAKRMFDEAFAVFERRCPRDAKDLRKYKPMMWGKVKAMHNVTHLDWEDCAQVILHIIDRGLQNFYALQRDELMKYCNPNPGDSPKLMSRARLSTWLYGHVVNKYNSAMTSFFAPMRTFDTGRIRHDIEEVIGYDTDGHLARALKEGRVRLKKGETITVGPDKKIVRRTPGTIGLSRYDIDDPACPAISDRDYARRPDLMTALNEFVSQNERTIGLIVSLDEKAPCPGELVQSFSSMAARYGLSLRDFMSAVRGLFGQDQRFQNV